MRTCPLTIHGPVPGERAIARTLNAAKFRPLPRAADRRAWKKLASRPWIRRGLTALIAAATRAREKPPTLARATDYLSFHRDGTRDPYSASAPPRRARLRLFCTAECFEHEGRFLDAILDESWLIAEETSWVMSAHLRRPGEIVPDVEHPSIDLGAAMTGRQLAETLWLLGREMDTVTPLWRKRINHEIRRRIVEPYLRDTSWWERATSNWNAVCNGGVVSAVLLADLDTRTRARVLHKALDRVRAFLKGFTSDGGCTEGPGYWLYGVSWFCAMAYYVHQATGGRIDMLADPIVPRVLEYPTKVVLSGDHVAAFADCAPQVNLAGGPIQWAAEKVGVTETVALTSRGTRQPSTDPLDLILAGEPRPFDPPQEAWLPKLQVLTARGEGAEGEQLVLAAKGGHNAETHNHNDVGAFIVHWRGESLLCDLGSGEYVRQMFSPRRYELLTTRSLGHNVPLVGGVEQATGRTHRARELRCAIDESRVVLSMDIAGAYPQEAGLASLVRTFEFQRGEEQWVDLTDRLEFAGRRRSYRLPLYTFGRFRRAGPGRVLAVGEKGSLAIQFDPKVLEARLEKVEHGDGRLAQRFGARLPRCMLSLRSRARSPIVRLRFMPRMP